MPALSYRYYFWEDWAAAPAAVGRHAFPGEADATSRADATGVVEPTRADFAARASGRATTAASSTETEII